MTNPFEDLQQALTNATGIDFILSGIIFGSILTVALFIILVFVFDPKGKGRADVTFLLSGGIGIAISTAVGWFPIWIPIFVGLIIAFVVFNPFGKDSSAG